MQCSRIRSAAGGGLQHSNMSRAAARRPCVRVAAAAKSSQPQKKGGSGFGNKGAKQPVETCACGSAKTYKECCKPQHAGTAAAPSVLDTVRARFSAILRKDVGYLVRTTTPAFHAFHYGGEPGASLAKLTDDLTSTCDHYEYSALKVREERPGETADEATVVFQYTVYDQLKPLVDEAGNKMRKVQIEESKFVRDAEGVVTRLWRFDSYKIVEVPEALAKAAEAQAQDLAVG